MFLPSRDPGWLAVACLAACVGCGEPTDQMRSSAVTLPDRLPLATTAGTVTETMPARPQVLRVCADPNNLPFTNERLEGFENRIAELIADELDASLEYTWWAQRRGFFRNTVRAGACDLVLGVPSSFELTATTAPYYRSTYVFVYPRGRGIALSTLDDPALRSMRIGVQMVGDDFANTPPAHALANRGIIGNVIGYTLYGDYVEPNPPSRIIQAVADGDIDVAIVWGPLAGYFAPRQRVPLEIVPVSPQIDPPYLPFVFDIAMGVRRGEYAFLEELDTVLQRRRADIDRILDDYGVPRVDASSATGPS